MPLYGPKAGNFPGERATPATKADYRKSIIDYMVHSGELAQQADSAPRHNPDRLPEMSLTNHNKMPRRMWQAAQEMVSEGVARVTNGSFESGSVYIVAGDNWEAR